MSELGIDPEPSAARQYDQGKQDDQEQYGYEPAHWMPAG